MFCYEGHTVPMAGHFSRLIWRLNAGQEDEEESPSSLLLAVRPCNLAGTPLFEFSKPPASAVRASSLGLRRDLVSMKRCGRDTSAAPAPPFCSYSLLSDSLRLIWTCKETLLSLPWATPDSCEVGPAYKRTLLGSVQFPRSSVIPQWLTGDLELF